jgi:hypothetical protein
VPYEHRTAYRHDNGEVEGFIGNGGTKKAAKDDAKDQIERKLRILGEDCTPALAIEFEKSRLIQSPSRLNSDELHKVQDDWRSGVRYT